VQVRHEVVDGRNWRVEVPVNLEHQRQTDAAVVKRAKNENAQMLL